MLRLCFEIEIKVLILFVLIFHNTSADENLYETCLSEEEDQTIVRWYSDINQCLEGYKDTEHNMLKLQTENEVLQQRIKHLEQHLLALSERLANFEVPSSVVVQRRVDGSENFDRNWEDYKMGFGSSYGEFFIGLDKLHTLTNTKRYELLIVMEDWQYERRYAKYDNFVVGNETEKYMIKSLGKYSGTAGDSLFYHKGKKFSTKDQDNDSFVEGSCAHDHAGAWWFGNCLYSHLNGPYLKSKKIAYHRGISWTTFKGDYYSLKFVEMTLRPHIS
ncbi:microfibril-associated glycoprotein 4-like [Stomoxys calcitrans]|uniref:Fibrinogen C-terminal domain-containing protein n=1 Tax=Stomoxys calcitrans TaxID=35570 RepID=A0A1I8PXD3_STOCA|nr:microfibril-associated glycoprotein 4-like [Stomoxys calcitrans]